MLHVHAFLGWRDVSSTHESLIFALLQEGDTGPSISISVVIKSNFSYMIHVRGRQLETVSPSGLLNSISSIKSLLSFLSHCSICIGNNDAKFISMANDRGGNFMDLTG